MGLAPATLGHSIPALEVSVAIPAMYDSSKVREYCESFGLAETRRLFKLDNHFNNADHHIVEAWISVQEAELRDESIAIARKALLNSRIAIAFSTITAIAIAVVSYFAK